MGLDRVDAIVRLRHPSGRVVDPAFVLPQSGNVIIIPTELVPHSLGQTVRRIDVGRIAVMIPNAAKMGPVT
jgi:hypothetical protein